MRKRFVSLCLKSTLFLLGLLTITNTLTAQTDFPIGSGNVGNDNTGYPCPLQDYYEGSRMQYLYRASELNAAGMGPGNITSIKFEVKSLATSTNTQFAIEQFTIRIGTTSTMSLTNNSWETVNTTVYGPVDYTATLGTNTFTFAAPFLWNGTDNIVIEICNGDPNNASSITYTGNPVVPWTTGLSFNGSHSYRADNLGNLCGTATTTNTGTQTTRPNIVFSGTALAACTGTPVGGTAATSATPICSSTTPFTLSVSGSSVSTGLTYQWESSSDNTTWNPIAGATNTTLTVTGMGANTYYRRKITCGANSSYSTSVLVTVSAPTYAALPFTESFEATWINVCDTRDVPNNSWRNSPVSGNDSWRRDDDGVAGGAWTNNFGLYNPTASVGTYSARFHSYQASSGTKGTLDLFINAATPATSKKLFFDYINTSGSDSLVIYLSTNGGMSFTRLDSVKTISTWNTKEIVFNSTSANTVIRFQATSDFGTTDIGLDNVRVLDFANCVGTPLPGTATSSITTACANTPFLITVAGATDAGGLTYQWEQSIDGGTTWTNVTGATNKDYNSTGGVQVTTSFRRKITCAGNTSTSNTVTIIVAPVVAYAALPYIESFENTWINGCDTRDIPNNFWRNNPVTGNNSWRRHDDGAAANWGNVNLGLYNPNASAGTYSARFHSYQATSGSLGKFDLYVNAATPSATKRLMFDYINTSGNDSMVIYISIDGGATFARLDSMKTRSAWTTKEIVFSSTSANTVIRFQARSDFGTTDIGLDNLILTDFPPCTGTPNGGTTAASSSLVCPNTPFSLSVTGATDASGITYQWQVSTDGGTTWTNIAGATAMNFNATGITAATSYRRQITCAGNSSFSAAVAVSVNTPTYATLPVSESFETDWMSICGVREVPNNSWRNTPIAGNNSWRRNDDGVSANWTNPANGMYTPDASLGSYSARFHSDQATSGTKGRFDLHINANTPATLKRISFDYINTSGNDSLTIFLSTDGGVNFVRLDSLKTRANWSTKEIQFTSSSATTVLRFEASSDNGTTDIGLDNINVIDFADCAGTPVGGTAVSSVSTACVDPFTLSVTGSTSAAGLTYQWQSSTDNATWTNIAGATSLNLTTTQVGTTYYRLVVSCSFSTQSGTSTSVQVISPTPAGGFYTIDNSLPTDVPARRFNNFNDAYNHIKCGINAPVVFSVLPGIGEYNEQLIMTEVPGASGINTVTFNGHGTAAIGFASAATNERAVIKLRGADYIIFDSLIINANTGTYGYGVQLIADADSNTVKHCMINLNTSATTQNFAGIVINGTEAGPIATGTVLCDYNTFTANTITGGYYGVTMVATTAGANGYNRFDSNDIKDFHQYGFYIQGSYNTTIEANKISRPTRTVVGDFTGIYFNLVNTLASVSKNRIFNSHGGAPTSTTAFTGINFNAVDPTSGSENVISNNLIYDVNGEGAVTGFSNTSSNNVWYYHNTISLDHITSTSTAATRGFYQTTLAGGLVWANNIITIRRGGTGAKHAMYMNTATTPLLADFNDYYVASTGGTTNAVGYHNGATRTTLADWQTATGQDANSVSRDPAYTNAPAGNYAPTNGGVDNKGFFVGITTDIVNVLRNTTTPDLGAYEFVAPDCVVPPVAGNTIFSDTTVCENVPVRLNLSISSWGASQTFVWEASTTAGGTYTPVTAVLSDPNTTIISTSNMFYRAAVTCGTTTVYSNPLELIVSPSLPVGTYTINKGNPTNYVPGVAGGNFNSFADAVSAMSCGIRGAVVFNVESGSGPYLEQVILDSIAGTSAVNTITFNGNGDTLRFNATNANERAVIKLRGADHIIFDSLVIDASGGTYGYGVQLINNADSNIFRKNTILTSTSAATNNFAGIVINSSDAGPITVGATNSDANLFDRNKISGGYYGMTLVGGNNTSSVHITDNKITNNTFEDFYNYGIQLSGADNTLVEGNIFQRPTRTTTATSVYAIYMATEESNGVSITRNRFTNMFGAMEANTGAFYGVYSTAVDASSSRPVLVSNNLFYNLNSNGAIYALYNTGSNNVWYHHNTISLDHTASATTGVTVGLYQTTTATGLMFKNNIVTISRGGTGAKHAIYTNTTATELESNYNNFYLTAGNAHVGYRTANRTTLADWQAASGDDANSFALNPLYVDMAGGNYAPQLAQLDNKGTPITEVPVDILLATRNTSTPDIGAYEFNPAPCVNPPVPGVAAVTPNTGICLETPIHLDITGHSALGSITFQWQISADGTNWTNASGIQYFPAFDTIATLSTYYRAAVTCSGTTTYTNTVQVQLNNILLQGTYTINSANAATYVPGVTGGNFQTYQSAVDALLCGITGPVTFNVTGTYNEQIRIPYIPNMSAVNTVTFQGTRADTLTFASTSGTANYTLKLDSARYFTFRNLAITGKDLTNGRAVELANTASNNTFYGNLITAPTTTASGTGLAAVYVSGIKGVNNVFRKNTINNGAYGIYFTGTSATVLAKEGHLIDSNTVNAPYFKGIYVQYADNMKVTNNTVNMNAPAAADAAGIHTNNVDSASRITGNIVNLTNNTAAVYGVHIQNTRALITDSTIVASNTINALTGNTGSVYGLAVAGSKGVSVVNNVIVVNTSGNTAYGLYNLNNTADVNYYNNSISLGTAATSGYAGYFTQTALGVFNVRNNIFSNNGGGNALFVNNPALFSADYNLLYTTGANLVKVSTGVTTDFATLKEWTATWNWDRFSISYAPAFVSATDLRPALANPDVWAIHGRGVQVKGNTYDFNGNYRPDALTLGVPDLGAYEFYPTALPTVLLATPVTPAPNTTQTFTYGSDTVMRITWGATAPPSIEMRRYSGVVPSGLPAGMDSMFFYTKVDIPGGADYPYAAKLYYIDSWQGSIPQQNRLGLGRTTPSNAWVVGANSKVNVGKKEISQEGIRYLDRFTGLLNPFAQPESEDSSSNRGKDFWVGYQRTNGFYAGNGGSQTMVLYFGAGDVPANVRVTIEGTSGTPWIRDYFVPANSALTSDEMPTTGADDARLFTEGFYDNRGIHITSDVPVVAYAHTYQNTNSGATMLMPTAVWGYEYYIMTSRQYYSSEISYSAFHFVAQSDSTWVEVNPSKPTLNGWVPNGGTQPNGSYLVKLNKGDAFQVLGALINDDEGHDLTGSYVKSIGNAQGQCHPIAVFSGSTRTGIGCGTSPGSSGDLIIQQIFPYQAWGTKYATAPTSNQTGPTASSNMTNIYRIMVKDPTTQVTVNGAPIGVPLVNNRYYQIESNAGQYIESNKPVLVAQFMSSSGSCPNTSGDGDPEMIYISPIEQGIKKTQFYRNSEWGIDENFITLIIPTEGLSTLKIDGVNYQAYPVAERYVYDHPNLAGYSIVTKRWGSTAGSSTVESDHAFTGIVYGIGSAESYGYNMGTLVKNLNNLSSVNNVFNTGATPTDYTCKGSPFQLEVLLPVQPQSILWQFSLVPHITPNTDVTQNNPVPVRTETVNGVLYYAYQLTQNLVLDTSGIIRIPIKYMSPTFERCDMTEEGAVFVQVLPKPETDFTTSIGTDLLGCAGETVSFTGDLITANGLALNQWNWTFHTGSTASGQTQTFSYPTAGTFPVKLQGITADGCVSDTTKQLTFDPKPIVAVVQNSLPACPGSSVTFTVASPVAGVVYNWYSTATGGAALGTGTSFTATNVTPPVSYYVSGTSAAGCVSDNRTKVDVVLPQDLAPAVVRTDSVGVNVIRFAWNPVQGAATYQVSVDGGITFVTPTSGAAGLTHTVTGLRPMQQASIIVRALGANSCQTSTTAAYTDRSLGDDIFIPNAFSPNRDGLNDVLLVYGNIIQDMKFTVFNQWGEKIFESTNQSTGWDGTYKGKQQPSGVYMYVARFVLRDGTTIDRKGSINLVR